MKKIIAASLLVISTVALADGGGCIRGPLSSMHKTLHFVGTATTSAVVTAATDNAYAGFAAGIAVGALREIQKERSPGMRCEYSSMAYDIAGSLAGSYTTQRFYVVPKQRGLEIGYKKQF